MKSLSLNLVYDEDLRLVVRYLMKRVLRPTKYWRKSIGVSKGWSKVTPFDETGPRSVEIFTSSEN